MKPKFSDLLADAARKKAPPKKDAAAAAVQKNALYSRLGALYEVMQAAYADCASEAGLRCDGCESNCCTSFFQHHTYVEWAYLWRGLNALPEEKRHDFVKRAADYVAEAKSAMQAGLRPSAMCPLNDNGLCALYSHRLMICRLHGTRNEFKLPDGRVRHFPGCARFTALPCARDGATGGPTLDRTPFYAQLADLELEFLKKAGRPLPRVNISIAEMIVLGPPRLR